MDGSMAYWINGQPVALDDYGELSSWLNGAPFVYHVAVTAGAVKALGVVAWATIKSVGVVPVATVKTIGMS